MQFIGQHTIMSQLRILLPKIYNEHLGANILLRGPSGWGKTRMAYLMCNYLVYKDFQFSIADKNNFNPNYWVHMIDEVHLIKEPEYLYPLMDSGKYVFVFTTNDVAVLPEALGNRCYNFMFEPYSREDLREIIRESLHSPMSDECLDMIIYAGGNNPRIIVDGIVKRLNMYQEVKGIEFNEKNLPDILKDYLGIIDGLDAECRRYIDELRKIGGIAALDTLSTILHINKDSLRHNVEPILVQRQIITITSKGRILNV